MKVKVMFDPPIPDGYYCLPQHKTAGLVYSHKSGVLSTPFDKVNESDFQIDEQWLSHCHPSIDGPSIITKLIKYEISAE